MKMMYIYKAGWRKKTQAAAYLMRDDGQLKSNGKGGEKGGVMVCRRERKKSSYMFISFLCGLVTGCIVGAGSPTRESRGREKRLCSLCSFVAQLFFRFHLPSPILFKLFPYFFQRLRERERERAPMILSMDFNCIIIWRSKPEIKKGLGDNGSCN